MAMKRDKKFEKEVLTIGAIFCLGAFMLGYGIGLM